MIVNEKNLFSLDIETSDEDPTRNSTYALEPWRLLQNEAFISSVAVAGPDGYIKQVDVKTGNMAELAGILKSLEGKVVIAHNAIFDNAWINIECGPDSVKRQKWKDTALLGKWINNGQRHQYKSYALKNMVEEYLPDHPMTEEFLDVKNAEVTPGQDYGYWLKRGRMDAILTRELYIVLMRKLPRSMYNGYNIEQRIIPTIANSWLTGLNLDRARLAKLQPRIIKAKQSISEKLGIDEKVIGSPKQLLQYLEVELGLRMPIKTPKGAGSTGKESLMKLHLDLASKKDGRSNIIGNVLDMKQLKTMESKFVTGAFKAMDYNKANKSLSGPRIFSTYTGRFTYSSKVMKKNQVGLATHQLPRKGPIRSCIIPPEGCKTLELDAAGQEMRFMAHFSKDETMVNAFNTGINLHSLMGSGISGDDYEDFQQAFHEGDKDITNFRYAGKLLNLSCQYRISGKALKSKFFSNYQIVISEAAGRQYEGMYKRQYPGVPKFWKSAIALAKRKGYAESIAGRRFYIHDWAKHNWGSSSSAINFPIQGSGGDHKELAIAYIAAKFPELIFNLDLHDGLWYSIPDEGPEKTKEHALEARDTLNKLNFHEIWDVEKVVDFPFDAQLGNNFGDVREL